MPSEIWGTVSTKIVIEWTIYFTRASDEEPSENAEDSLQSLKLKLLLRH